MSRVTRLSSRNANMQHDCEQSNISKSKGARTSRSALGDISNKGARAGGKYGGSKGSSKPFSVATEPAASAAAASKVSLHSAAPPKPRETYEDFDAKDQHLPQYATEYVNDIYKFFREVEGRHGPSPMYMTKQTDINERMRAILIDWLVEVHLKFKLMPQTLYLTVNVLDRFLERKTVSRQKLQLVGCTAMLVASKYEEIYAPEVRDFVYISDRAFTRQELLAMESVVLNILKFNMTVPTIPTFMTRFCKVAGADAKTKQLATFYVERMLQEYSMLKYLPSTIAASSLRLAMLALGDKPWTPALQRHTRYTDSNLRQCMNDIATKIREGEGRSLQAVKKKYTSSRYLEVATVPLPSVTMPASS